jgi:hypothetical protein
MCFECNIVPEQAFEQIDVAAELKFQNIPAKVIDHSVSSSCIRLPLNMIIHLSRDNSHIANVLKSFIPFSQVELKR